jgi:signal transduction histidine kinase
MRRLPLNDVMLMQLRDIENERQNSLDESNMQLKLNLFYFNLFILLLSGISSYYFAKKTLKPIEDMVVSQNHFTADASHELKTPLTAMRTEIEVLLRNNKITLADAKALLTSNLEEIAKLESLSNALLKLSKYQDQVRVEFREQNISDIIIEAYEKLAPLAEKRDIKFNNKIIDINVLGDKQSLVELFIILIDNAIKYSPPKSLINISITKENKWISVSIKDYGIGMKASDIPYIFNRFYRSDSSRNKEQVNGYGLGLSIAHKIVELHQGKILVSSKPAKGSEFTVKLPAL